jgi:very-short-patch-repair endonuclease
MKFEGLNGRTYNVDLNKYKVRLNDRRKKSAPHLIARRLIRETLKGQTAYEEVPVKGVVSTGRQSESRLYLDFLIPSQRLVVEVHGHQHYEFNRFFHKTRAGFARARNRDELKLEWCELNGLMVIELKYSDTEDEWREQIANRK